MNVACPIICGFVLARLGFVDGEGFEPSKPVATDLQSVPFDRSGTRPGDYVLSELFGD
jgi:hypothetical protein